MADLTRALQSVQAEWGWSLADHFRLDPDLSGLALMREALAPPPMASQAQTLAAAFRDQQTRFIADLFKEDRHMPDLSAFQAALAEVAPAAAETARAFEELAEMFQHPECLLDRGENDDA